MSEEISIVARNFYGPNGEEVCEYLELARTSLGQAVKNAVMKTPSETMQCTNSVFEQRVLEDADRLLSSLDTRLRSIVTDHLVFLVNKTVS